MQGRALPRIASLAVALSLAVTAARSQADTDAMEDLAGGFVESLMRAGGEDITWLGGKDRETKEAIASLRSAIGRQVHFTVIHACANGMQGGVWEVTRPYALEEVMATLNPFQASGAERLVRDRIVEVTQFAFDDAQSPLGFFARMIGGTVGGRMRIETIHEIAGREAKERALANGCGEDAFLIQENALLFAMGLPSISLEGVREFQSLRLVSEEDVSWGPDAFGAHQAPEFRGSRMRYTYSDYLEAGPLAGRTVTVCRYRSSSGLEFTGLATASMPTGIPLEEQQQLWDAHGLSRTVGTDLACGTHPGDDVFPGTYSEYVAARARAVRAIEAQLER